MSDHELYEIARKRIDRRTRRWTIWAINLAILIASVGAVVFLSDSLYQSYAIGGMLVWAAIFVLHTIIVTMADSRDGDIEKEFEKLREAVLDGVYEKPKRLHLTDDGEITDLPDNDYEETEDRMKA